MPVSSKAKISELRVGIMAAFALAVLGVLVFLLAGTNPLFKTTSDIYTYFDDSAAIAVAAPVTLNGINVGKVAHVGLSGVNEPGKIIKVEMQIRDEYLSAIPVDSQSVITAGNLLGTKYINIRKGRSTQMVSKGGALPSQNLTTIDDFVQQGNTALSAMQTIVQKVDAIISDVESGKGTIGMLLVDDTIAKKMTTIVTEAEKLVVTLNNAAKSDQNSVGKLLNDKGAMYDDIRGSITRINTLMDGLEKGEGTAGKLLKDPALYDDARKTVADLRKILADVEAGQGDVGKLLKSDELHQQVQGTLARLDTLLDKMNKGEGTIAQLLNNPSLYESLDGTSKEIRNLIKDFRANPKKFLTIQLKLF
ncbi:MAG TPA: MlaD family protein [Bryobacteraceae bacterium]|nr:MlaD family protein [Bryobacteraceae bacterium]